MLEWKRIKKLGYTGRPLTSDIEITVKIKGKATVIITGNGKTSTGSEYTFVGSKVAAITIAAGNFKDIKNFFGENTVNFFTSLFNCPEPALTA